MGRSGHGIPPTRQQDLQDLSFKKYGKVWREVIPGMGNIFNTTVPEDVEKVFRADSRFPARPGFDTIKVRIFSLWIPFQCRIKFD